MMSKAFLICLMMVLADMSLSMDQQIDVDRNKIGSKVLSRRKRFIIFPTGSSFSVAVCMTIGVYGNPQFSMFSWALNYGFAYNLPTNSTSFTNPPEGVLDFPFFSEMMQSAEEETTTTTTTTTTTEKPEEHDAPAWNGAAPPTGGEPSRRKFHVYYQPKFETKPMMQRRYRREIYRNIESVIDK